MTMDERIPVNKILINIGVNANGQIMGNAHVESDRKRLFVIPMRFAIIETTDLSGVKTILEIPIGQFGLEYVAKNTAS